MEKLTKKIELESLGGALFDMAAKETEKAVTRALVGINKSNVNLKKTGLHLCKATLAKVANSYIESEIINTGLDIYASVKLVQASLAAYKAANEFCKGYKEATDDDVAEIEKILGLKEVNDNEKINR